MRLIDADALTVKISDLMLNKDSTQYIWSTDVLNCIRDAPTVKPKRRKIDPLTTDHFGAVLNCAVRYCIGRCTYMPGLVTERIMANCHGKLNERTLFVMGRDIDEAKDLGMDCDVRTWMTFREWIRQEAGE